MEAQDSLKQKALISLSAFIDTYYSYDFNKPGDHQKPAFIYNHNRHNEFTVNLALINFSYKDASRRGNFGLMAGTYPQYNLAAEPALLRHIYEANIGIKISRKKDLWVDVGILPSHIGFETAISKDCWTLTRSILAENSPYYETGARVSYKTDNRTLYLAALVLNGWQRISRVDHNNTPAFGTQLIFTPYDKLSINSSSFIGNDKPDSMRKWRSFHNLYVVWQVSKAWGLTFGFDVGVEQKENKSTNLNSWYAPVIILRYQKNGWALAGRAEYYDDKEGVIVSLVNAQSFRMQSYSLNIDRNFGENVLWRLEGRLFKSSDSYFVRQGAFTSTNAWLTTSLSISID